MTEEELEEELERIRTATARAIGMTTGVAFFLAKLLPCVGLPEGNRSYLKRMLNNHIEDCHKIVDTATSAETEEAKLAEISLLLEIRNALG